jgi:hypothetical protein
MDSTRFKEIVGAFLDSNDHFDKELGDFVLQVGNELISFDLSLRNGSLWVTEGNNRTLAEEWIIKRLAMLPRLAERILASVPENVEFIKPQAEFLDQINKNANDEPEHVIDAEKAVSDFISKRPGGTCSVLYLTSDAGEGKTTLINHLARSQAEMYQSGQTDWLLVPVA